MWAAPWGEGGKTGQESREASGGTDRRAAAAPTWLNFLSQKPGQTQQSKSSWQSTSPSPQEQRLLPAHTHRAQAAAAALRSPLQTCLRGARARSSSGASKARWRGAAAIAGAQAAATSPAATPRCEGLSNLQPPSARRGPAPRPAPAPPPALPGLAGVGRDLCKARGLCCWPRLLSQPLS